MRIIHTSVFRDFTDHHLSAIQQNLIQFHIRTLIDKQIHNNDEFHRLAGLSLVIRNIILFYYFVVGKSSKDVVCLLRKAKNKHRYFKRVNSPKKSDLIGRKEGVDRLDKFNYFILLFSSLPHYSCFMYLN